MMASMGESAPARLYPAVFFLFLLLLVGALSYVVLRPFLAGILWATVLAVTLWPLWRKVRRRAAPRTGLAAGLFSFAVGLVVLLPAALVSAALVNQAAAAAVSLGRRLKERDLKTWSDVIAYPAVDRAFAWLRDLGGLSIEDFQARAAELAAKASGLLAAVGSGVVLSFLDVVLTFVLTLFLLFFFLRDGETMVDALTELIPVPETERRRIVASLGEMLDAIFKGSLVCALVQGTSGGLAWAVVGFPSALLAGVAMAVLSLLPVGGTAIVWAPAMIVLFVQGRSGTAIAFLAWNVLVTSTLADNVLKPLLIGRKGGDLSTLLVFLGVFGGIAAFGLLGVFVGPMTLALGLMLLRVLRELARSSRASAEA
jgi:predicted PurR-regulated permease PerM